MHYTQNDKIRQATEGTIVVGVDIGSEKNYERAFRGNGIEITRKAYFFPNTLTGFKAFEEWITSRVTNTGKKTDGYIEIQQTIRHLGSPVQESCTPGSTGGVPRKGHVYQPNSHVRFFGGVYFDVMRKEK